MVGLLMSTLFSVHSSWFSHPSQLFIMGTADEPRRAFPVRWAELAFEETEPLVELGLWHKEHMQRQLETQALLIGSVSGYGTF